MSISAKVEEGLTAVLMALCAHPEADSMHSVWLWRAFKQYTVFSVLCHTIVS